MYIFISKQLLPGPPERFPDTPTPSVSCIFPGFLSQMVFPRTPVEGGSQGASSVCTRISLASSQYRATT